jgi:hypothetical protein
MTVSFRDSGWKALGDLLEMPIPVPWDDRKKLNEYCSEKCAELGYAFSFIAPSSGMDDIVESGMYFDFMTHNTGAPLTKPDGNLVYRFKTEEDAIKARLIIR